jgi:hypothetical protein
VDGTPGPGATSIELRSPPERNHLSETRGDGPTRPVTVSPLISLISPTEIRPLDRLHTVEADGFSPLSVRAGTAVEQLVRRRGDWDDRAAEGGIGLWNRATARIPRAGHG